MDILEHPTVPLLTHEAENLTLREVTLLDFDGQPVSPQEF
jgi:hypothetical protein